MIDVEWRENDMRKGLKIIYYEDADPDNEDPFDSLLELDWPDVDALISLCIAYRELKSSKERLGVFISSHDNTSLLNMNRSHPDKEGSI
jgi:hypothetical protein